MSVYFCIDDVLARLETNREQPDYNALIDVAAEPPACGGFPDDAFILGSTPSLLDLNGGQAATPLAELAEAIPLYHFNIELALDEALAQRHDNAPVRAALTRAFAGQPLPNTLRAGVRDPDELGGALRHPMLEHLDLGRLCTLYIDFLRALGNAGPEYGFERTIIGRHEAEFAGHFDGFLQAGGGKVRAEILLGFGHRADHDSGRPLDSYVESGQNKALRMRVRDPQELLWAWLEADDYQRRRCRDIHRLKLLPGLPRPPNWVRADIFALLEKEAMKQSFAESLKHIDSAFPALEKMPATRRAVQANADGQVDELLQQLLAQTLNFNAPYSGAAGKFAEAADRRLGEARLL